jgi:hypothetical protein
MRCGNCATSRSRPSRLAQRRVGSVHRPCRSDLRGDWLGAVGVGCDLLERRRFGGLSAFRRLDRRSLRPPQRAHRRGHRRRDRLARNGSSGDANGGARRLTRSLVRRASALRACVGRGASQRRGAGRRAASKRAGGGDELGRLPPRTAHRRSRARGGSVGGRCLRRRRGDVRLLCPARGGDPPAVWSRFDRRVSRRYGGVAADPPRAGCARAGARRDAVARWNRDRRRGLVSPFARPARRHRRLRRHDCAPRRWRATGRGAGRPSPPRRTNARSRRRVRGGRCRSSAGRRRPGPRDWPLPAWRSQASAEGSPM